MLEDGDDNEMKTLICDEFEYLVIYLELIKNIEVDDEVDVLIVETDIDEVVGDITVVFENDVKV